jgi:hypothetical protein
MLGFETIGNATAICYDGDPVLVTDPWIAGDAYFGSWAPAFDIPPAQRDAVRRAKYAWFSHGHPDHTNLASLDLLSGKTLLLPDHVGGRMERDLKGMGFTVQVMPDRKWVQLSDRIKALCVADYNQDGVLLVDVDGTLLVDVNDAGEMGWGRFVKKIIKEYKRSFLLKLFGYGDADMINVMREDGTRLLPPAPDSSAEAREFWDRYLNEKLSFWTRYFGTTHVIPFSMFHLYQREDSLWADRWRTPLDSVQRAKLNGCEMLPAFIRFDCAQGSITELNPAAMEAGGRKPEEFGDNWSEPLSADEAAAVASYFRSIEYLKDHLDFVRVDVGGKEHTVDLSLPGKRGRGITFEVPRGSLMTAVQYEFFDDLLIGNFMKTTLHGDWGTALAPNVLYAHFSPFVTRYADNGGAKTRQQLDEYFSAYRQRARFDHVLHRFEREGAQKLRSWMAPGSFAFRASTKAYSMIKGLR